jgi:hypothetical protein
MRHWIDLLENARYPSWIDHLLDAVNAAQVGFHFEEGGCWGMAQALHEALPGSEIIVICDPRSGEPSHGMVRLGDVYVDWTGAHRQPWDGPLRVVTPEELADVAEFCVCDIRTDYAEARSLIENARELAAE